MMDLALSWRLLQWKFRLMNLLTVTSQFLEDIANVSFQSFGIWMEFWPTVKLQNWVLTYSSLTWRLSRVFPLISEFVDHGEM